MTSQLLKTLEKGLELLKKHTKKRKDALTAKLTCKEKISSDDEAWLDNEGNIVDEERVVGSLKRANNPD